MHALKHAPLRCRILTGILQFSRMLCSSEGIGSLRAPLLGCSLPEALDNICMLMLAVIRQLWPGAPPSTGAMTKALDLASLSYITENEG